MSNKTLSGVYEASRAGPQMTRPILFSPPMVLALLAGRKTQTRRRSFKCEVGDILWVREAYQLSAVFDDTTPAKCPAMTSVKYLADGACNNHLSTFLTTWGRYRHARFMPRWASRIDLEVTAVRREQVRDISEADVKAEGIHVLPLQLEDDPSAWWQSGPGENQRRTPIWSFQALWESLHGPGSWDAPEDVNVIEFRRIK